MLGLQLLQRLLHLLQGMEGRLRVWNAALLDLL